MDVAIQPNGFDLYSSGVHAKNKATGQEAKWDEDLTAWVDSTTGKPIPRAESISAEPPPDPPYGDECRRLRWRQAFLEQMASTYRSEAAHAESAASSEEANVSDNAKAFSKHSGHELDPAQVGLGLGVDMATAGGITAGLVEAGLWPLAVPLAAAMIGASLGAAVREALNSSDEEAAAKKSLTMLEAARARLAFWREHAAALMLASGDAAQRARALRDALDKCKDDDPCRAAVRDAGGSAGRLEALRRTRAAVDASRSAANEASAKAYQAAETAKPDAAAVYKDVGAMQRGVATAAERESYRLERLISEAQEEAAKAGKALEDCEKKGTVAPPVKGAGGPGGPKAPTGMGTLALWGLVFVVVLVGLGLGALVFGRPPAPSATSSAPASPSSSASFTVAPSSTAAPSPSVEPTPAPPTEVRSIDDFLASLGVDQGTRDGIASVTVSDALSDWEEAAPAVDPAAVDIVTAVTMEGTLGPQTKDRVHLCGVGVICASDANGNPGTTAGEAADYYIYMMQLRGPVLGFETADTGSFEMGIVLFDETPPGGGDPEALDQGPKSFLTGANAAYSIRFTVPTSDSPGAMFRLAHDAGEPFLHTESSTSFALVRGNVLAAFIPEQEFDGAVSGRLYGYYQVGAGAVSDTWPDMSAAMLTYEPGTLYEVHLP